jgi:hypothetical protein
MLERKLLWEKGNQQIELIRDSKDPVWEEIYEVFCKAFPIPEERDSLEALKGYIKNNTDGTFGPDKDPLARDNNLVLKEGGRIVGVRMLEWMNLCFGASCGFETYTFIPEDLRRNGYSLPLMETGNNLVRSQAKGAGTRLLGFFAEINNPFKMGEKELALDNAVMNPLERQVFWSKAGYSRLDTHYEQPAVDGSENPVQYLDLWFKPENSDSKGIEPLFFLDAVAKYFSLFLDIDKAVEHPSYKRIESSAREKELIQFI